MGELEKRLAKIDAKKAKLEMEQREANEDLMREEKEIRLKKLLADDGLHLTEKQKEEAFWTWIWCNAETHFPEAKRFLGNSDTELDFWELLHPDKTKENLERDEPEKLTCEQTTRLMAEVIEWGILKGSKILKKDPYWLHETPEKLRRKIIENTAGRRY